MTPEITSPLHAFCSPQPWIYTHCQWTRSASNYCTINTSAKTGRNARKINTYKITRLKTAQNQHLQKNRGAGMRIRWLSVTANSHARSRRARILPQVGDSGLEIPLPGLSQRRKGRGESMSHHYSGPNFGFPHGDARLNFTDLYAFPKPGGIPTAIRSPMSPTGCLSRPPRAERRPRRFVTTRRRAPRIQEKRY
jgi:hypothetical protein